MRSNLEHWWLLNKYENSKYEWKIIIYYHYLLTWNIPTGRSVHFCTLIMLQYIVISLGSKIIQYDAAKSIFPGKNTIKLSAFALRLRTSWFWPYNNTIVIGCVEDNNWWSKEHRVKYWGNQHITIPKYRCADYERAGYCEGGGVGKHWKNDWTWPIGTDPEDGDARDVCCVCGGRGKGNMLLWFILRTII